jgi:hypothetical protein
MYFALDQEPKKESKKMDIKNGSNKNISSVFSNEKASLYKRIL